MPHLHRLLLGEVERAEQRHRRAVTQPGEIVQLAAQHPAEPANRARAKVLDIEIERPALADHRDFPHQIAGRAARRRTQRKPHVHAGQIIGQQQVALGLVGVEHVGGGELFEIARHHLFRRPGIAAYAHRCQSPEDDIEIGGVVGKVLLGDLYRGEIALTAQDGIGLGADVAQHRNRHFAPAIIGHRLFQREARHPFEAVELRADGREADVGEFRPVEGAGRAFEIAVDGERRALLLAPQFRRDEVGAVGRGELRRERFLRGGRNGGHQQAARGKQQRQSRRLAPERGFASARPTCAVKIGSHTTQRVSLCIRQCSPQSVCAAGRAILGCLLHLLDVPRTRRVVSRLACIGALTTRASNISKNTARGSKNKHARPRDPYRGHFVAFAQTGGAAGSVALCDHTPAASITFEDAADSAPCSTASLPGRVAAGYACLSTTSASLMRA